jgi:hypothetical protein
MHAEIKPLTGYALSNVRIAPTTTGALLKALKSGDDTEINGVTYLRIFDEWKASPHGSKGDFDTNCYWLTEEELDDE